MTEVTAVAPRAPFSLALRKAAGPAAPNSLPNCWAACIARRSATAFGLAID